MKIWSKLLLTGCSAIIATTSNNSAEAQVVIGDGEIRGTENIPGSDSPIVIKTSTSTAGAITSLVWNGVQFVNSDFASDHGRQMQSSAFFTILNETKLLGCYNPTEAGSKYNRAWTLPSSSKLLSFSAMGNTISSASYPAYWKDCVYDNPNFLTTNYDISGKPLSNNPMLTDFINSVSDIKGTTKSSDVKFSKNVTIGFQGYSNIIEYKVLFQIPESPIFTEANFESLTDYVRMTTISDLFRYKPTSPDGKSAFTLTELPDSHFHDTNGNIVPSTDYLPQIFSSPDGNFAIGVYSPDVLNVPYNNQSYLDADISTANHYFVGRSFVSPDSNSIAKWNVTAHRENLKPGPISFTEYVVIGTKTQVQSGIDFLDGFFKASAGTIKGEVSGFEGPRNNMSLVGWACGTYTDDPVSVHLYLGPAGSGKWIGRYLADTPSVDKADKLSISAECRAYGPHRFKIELPQNVLNGSPSGNIYVYGISPRGGNLLLGTSTLPAK